MSSPQRPPRGEHWAVQDQCRLARERVLPCQTHSRTVKSPSRALMTGPAIALMTDRQRKLVSSTCGRERSQRASIPDASRADHNRQASQTSEPSGTPPGVRQQGKDASACRPNPGPREHLVLERDARLNAAHKRRHAVSKLSRALAQHDRSKRRTQSGRKSTRKTRICPSLSRSASMSADEPTHPLLQRRRELETLRADLVRVETSLRRVAKPQPGRRSTQACPRARVRD